MNVRWHSVVLTFLFLSVHLLLFWHHGIREFYDSRGYLQGADYILQHGKLEDMHHLFYSIPILTMAFFRWLSPGTVGSIIIFQCFLSGLATVALYKAAEKIFNSNTAGLLAGVIFLLWLDNVHWNITTMTESIARSIICFVVYALAHWENRPQDKISIAALLLFVFFTRPTGVVIIIGAFIFLLIYYWDSLLERRWIMIGVTLAAFAIAIVAADRMLDHWDFSDQYLKGNIVTFADDVKGSPLFHEAITLGPPESTSFATTDSPIGRILIFAYENPIHFLKAAGLKIFYLLSFTRPYYSWPHNLYSVVWMILIYLLFVFGWKSTTNLPIKLFVLTAIVLNCGLIGISSVDWDNRFYIPMEPGIILLAGGGAAWIISRIKSSKLSIHLN
jgi:hypothetical protein